MKSRYKSKTFWVAVITIIAGAVQTAAQNPEFAEWSGPIVLGSGVLSLILRFLTRGPIL